MFFIILTTEATLHAHGIVKIDIAKRAPDALRASSGQWKSGEAIRRQQSSHQVRSSALVNGLG
jgi:hypothetical protein